MSSIFDNVIQTAAQSSIPKLMCVVLKKSVRKINVRNIICELTSFVSHTLNPVTGVVRSFCAQNRLSLVMKRSRVRQRLLLKKYPRHHLTRQ